MGEVLIADPAEEIADRVEVNLHEGALRVQPDGPDFGDSLIEQYMAKVSRGSIPVDFSLPNRPVRIPMIAHASGETLTAARARLQAKVARWQQEGGVLKRVMADGAVYYLDVVSATLKYGAKSSAAYGLVDADVELVLDTLPDWYGLEVSYDTLSATGTLAATIKASGVAAVLPGDYPGRCRLVVSDTSGNDQLGLLWGVRSRPYSSAATAALRFAAQSLTPLDTAANATVASTACVRHQNLSTGWTPVLGTNLTAGTFLTHTGSLRPYVRVYSTSAVPPRLRFVYDVGDLTLPVENKAIAIPGANNFYLVDLGEIRLDPVSAGDHRWQGVVQAKGAAGGENVSVAEVEFQPLDESEGALRSPASASVPLTGFSARDEFNQSAGALTGKTAAVGGTWAGAGDADDFAVEATGHTAQRTAVSDVSAINQGRLAISGVSAFAAQAAQVDVKHTELGSSWAQQFGFGAIARYTNTSNFVVACLGLGSSGGTFQVIEGGAGTAIPFDVPFVPVAGQWRTIRVSITAAGTWFVWAWPTGSAPGDPVASGYDSRLATGGTLATGKPGFIDWYSLAGAATRNYDNFGAWAPVRDAVLHASQSAELATDGMSREDSTGTAYGPVSHVTGDLPRIPPSGVEERPVEVFLRGSRGDLDQIPDPALDGIEVTPHVRPSWLLVPA